MSKMKANNMSKRISWGIMTFLAMGIALYAIRYFSLNPDVCFPQQREIYLAYQAGIITYIIGGVLALGLGPFQFLNKLRKICNSTLFQRR
jgi:hypothetical protein